MSDKGKNSREIFVRQVDHAGKESVGDFILAEDRPSTLRTTSETTVSLGYARAIELRFARVRIVDVLPLKANIDSGFAFDAFRRERQLKSFG